MEKISKAIIISVLVILFAIYGKGQTHSCFDMHLFHANIFHLLANCWAVFIIRRADWIPAYAIAVPCAIPFAHSTVGFSGVIFAALGIIYGRYPSKLFWWAVAIVLITALIPSVNAAFHLICMFAGFIAGYAYEITRLYVKDRNR